MAMIDLLSPNLVDLGLRYFKSLSNYPRTFYFPALFAAKGLNINKPKSIPIDFNTLKTMIPKLINIFEDCDYFGIPGFYEKHMCFFGIVSTKSRVFYTFNLCSSNSQLIYQNFRERAW